MLAEARAAGGDACEAAPDAGGDRLVCPFVGVAEPPGSATEAGEHLMPRWVDAAFPPLLRVDRLSPY